MISLKKGDEFLAIETGTIYRIYATSKHGTHVNIASKKIDSENFVVHMIPERTYSVERLIEEKMWIPNTPAARALYAAKTR